MTIGQFLRTTAHNFRIFWRASFSGAGGPVMIEGRTVGDEVEAKGDWTMAGDEGKAGPGDAEVNEAPMSDRELVDRELVDSELVDGESTDRGLVAASSASTDRVGEDDVTEIEDVASAVAAEAAPADAPAVDEPAPLEPEAAVVADVSATSPEADVANAVDAAAHQSAVEQPEDAAVAAAAEPAAAESDAAKSDAADVARDDAEAHALKQAVAEATLVQAALGIVENDDAPAADIMLESHGRRLGLTQLIESLLFVSDEPVEAVQLAKALDVSLDAVNVGLQRLDKLYRLTGRGLRVQTREGHYQLITAPECAGAIEDFLNLDLTAKLSGPALETLAVIAYRQPVTRIQIEAVRGVDCAGVLRSMTQRGLIEEVGRLETVGRPILYGVTDLFMQHFGLTAIQELPPLEAQDEDMLWAATQLAEMEGTEDAAAETAPATETEPETAAEA